MEPRRQVSDLLSEVAHAEGAATATEPATGGRGAGPGVVPRARAGPGADPDAGRWDRLRGSVLVLGTAVVSERALPDQTGC